MAPKKSLALTDLPTNVAHMIATRMNRGNLARLRTASKQTKNFGRAGYTCTSQREDSRLRVNVTAVSETGEVTPFTVGIAPAFSWAGDQNTVKMHVNIQRGYHQVGFGSITPTQMTFRWYTFGPRPSQYVRDQIIGCARTEVHRHADFLAGIYVQAWNAIMVQEGPTTAAQVRAAASNVTEN